MKNVGWRDLNEDQLLVVDCHTTQAFLLSHVSCLVWRNLENNNVDQLINIVLEEYDIGRDIAEYDIQKFINDLKSKKLVS